MSQQIKSNCTLNKCSKSPRIQVGRGNENLLLPEQNRQWKSHFLENIPNEFKNKIPRIQFNFKTPKFARKSLGKIGWKMLHNGSRMSRSLGFWKRFTSYFTKVTQKTKRPTFHIKPKFWLCAVRQSFSNQTCFGSFFNQSINFSIFQKLAD